MSERNVFDGLGTHPDPVPFDAHEKVVRSHHGHSQEGYKPAEYEHSEYPKMIDDGVIVHSKEEEDRLKAEPEVAAEPEPAKEEIV